MPEIIDYEAVLGDLEAKKAAIEAAIMGIRQMLSLGAQTAPGSTNGRGAVESQALESDTFFGLSLGEAAKKFLRITKRKQSATAIAKALEAGGIQHTSKYLPNTVRTSLIRLAENGEVVQVGKEWGLAEWYPGRRKSKKQNGDSETAVGNESGGILNG